jgi:hypothetical protein
MKICIPSMANHVKKDYIFKILSQLNIGHIGRIIENPHFKNPEKKRVFIYVEFNNSNNAKRIKERLEKDQPIFLVYDRPWFWKIVKSLK